ncbi:pancreatic lipase-related protein 2-like isoform X1 [Vespa velutina]|uniref:pancreatic lipase-related protein 2-like isoform X1 n=1 Tax=Vespa velutina TaxID=202808 RepID=UPI001FB3C8EF|nr:pancreatic lipase-related protein 2-like isoform X1 [Vespa velutina]XP_047354534.1 pancreatic lipase-related protein 2-like isoform X1 [Vespa velutina]XP_047354535.1 pancreatic lipase-related protein 2-like isoform X1 [Vespa velutina]
MRFIEKSKKARIGDLKSLILFIRDLTIVCLMTLSISSIEGKRNHGLLNMSNRIKLRRLGYSREELKPTICYDLVGCFADPPVHLSLKRPPEHPNVIQTKFLLYNRSNREDPKVITYADRSESLLQSGLNVSKQLKVLIHGFKGSGSDYGLIRGINALLDLEDVNILILDWTRGAGTSYAAAVANTELVGRQLALVLLDAFNLGTDPMDVHVTGFSLGAHVGGCAAEMLKKWGLLLARITGLDPASPFFRSHLFREKSRKLDATDAHLVDVIHTDGSEDFTDGFGLLKPIGHIDMFPNGGKEQPGCSDVKNSVVVSHLKEELLDRQIACSHLRAWQLYVESILTQSQKCKFVAWPCPQGFVSYAKGTCFPMESTGWSQEMGYRANRGPLGSYFLPTRSEPPFCGEPFRVTIATAKGLPRTMGVLLFKTYQNNSTTTYKINCILPKLYNQPTMFYNIAANDFSFALHKVPVIKGTIKYHKIIERDENEKRRPNDSGTILLSKLFLENRKGDRWECCNFNTSIGAEETHVELQSIPCDSP